MLEMESSSSQSDKGDEPGEPAEAAQRDVSTRSRPSRDQLAEALDVLEAELPYRTDVPDISTELSMGVVAMAAQRISGPAPSASEMAGYRDVDPMLPKRIMVGVDEERRHRHRMEAQAVKADALVSVLGTAAGVLFVAVALGIAALPSARD